MQPLPAAIAGPASTASAPATMPAMASAPRTNAGRRRVTGPPLTGPTPAAYRRRPH